MLATSGFSVTFDRAPRAGAEHMARDAAAFDALEAGRAAPAVSVRWFRWDRPTISLGRGQDPAQVLDLARCAADGVPMVVRPTGGRAVFHVDEWTYVALVPLAHPVLGGSLARSCRSVTAWIGDALADAFGVVADPAPGRERGTGTPAGDAVPPRELERGACFVRSFGYELSVGGRKLMGSAQRRGRVALLQQGSLLVGPGQERLARWLRPGGGAAAVGEAERMGALARATTHLVDLLGLRPDEARFERAFRERGERIAAMGARSW